MKKSRLKKKLPINFFTESWKLFTEQGRQYWRYAPSPALRSALRSNRFDEQETLDAMSQAFVYNKTIAPHATDAVYRQSRPPLRLTRLAESPEILRKKGKKSSLENLSSKAFHALVKGWDYFASLQTREGHFPGDYGGPLFLSPGLALLSFITDYNLGKPQVTLMKRYILNHQNSDGGWGLHIEGESILFTTVINYVALRIWGEDSPKLKMAKKWIRDHGGAADIPSWGKYFLALLGLYEWKGVHSLFPEAWLLPSSLVVSPLNFWCHARMVYLPLCYLYGIKFRPSSEKMSNALIHELRKELYLEDYDTIDWTQLRSRCCSLDRYFPLTKRFRFVSVLLNFYEKMFSFSTPFLGFLRRRALKVMAQSIDHEDIRTHHINLGPINKVYNALVVYHRLQADPSHPELKRSWEKHCERFQDYLWVAEDGMKMNGYNGSQLWDTVFAGRALMSVPTTLERRYRQPLNRIESYLHHHRLEKGGWPFSTRDNSWSVSDCSAEGLNLSLDFHDKKDTENYRRLTESVDFLLAYQNRDGGWPTYEVQRAPSWLECLNSSMVFGDIMVDYSYVECSSANIQALEKFHETYPQYRSQDMVRAIASGRKYIVSKQREDGSWYGSWGVCFTYGIFFAVKGLVGSSNEGDLQALVPTVNFLKKNKNPDGSWGESYLSSSKKIYHSTSGQAVHTAWVVSSLLAILKVRGALIKNKVCDEHYIQEIQNLVEAGVRFLLRIQKSDGDWPQPHITGVFNHNCMISYTNYRNIFPLWALGLYFSYSISTD